MINESDEQIILLGGIDEFAKNNKIFQISFKN